MMSKPPAHNATTIDRSTASGSSRPVTAIQAAEGDMANAQPKKKWHAQV